MNVPKSTLVKREDLCERMKEHDRDVRLVRTQTSAVSEHVNKTGHHLLWNEVKFIDLDSHWYTKRVKDAIHIRLHPDNINRDKVIKIPDPWIPTIKKHKGRPVRQQTTVGITWSQTSQKTKAYRNNADQNPLVT